MSFLNAKSSSAPRVMPVPASPAAADNTAAEEARLAAERAAVAEAKSSGRRSTIVAGRVIAEEEQMDRAKKRQTLG